MAQDIQLICFDLGGVLIRLCDGWDHACRRAGVTPSKPITDEDIGRVIPLVYQEEVGALASGQFFEEAAPHLGLSPEDTRAMSDAWLCGAFPGIDPLIDAVNDAGHTTACLSNTNDNHWQAMMDPAHTNGLPLHKLDHRFASQLVRERKPNAAIYRHVEKVTGVPGSSILFFDDSRENIDAADSLGWQTCHVTDPDDPAAQMTAHLKGLNLI